LAGLLASTVATFAEPPVNDNFTNRIRLTGTNLTVQGDNYGGSMEAGEDGGNAGGVYSGSVWYEWRAPTGGIMYVSAGPTTGWQYLGLSVYRGNSLTALVGAASTAPGGFAVAGGDTFVFRVVTTYYPYWGGGGQSGPFALTVTMDVPPPLSGNDAFADRIELTLPDYHFAGGLCGATNEPGETLPAAGATQTLWWSCAPASSGLLSLTTTGLAFTPAVAVYEGSQVTSLTRQASLTSNSLLFRLEAGHEYALQVGSGVTPVGAVTLDTHFDSLTNDAFASATVLTGATNTVPGNNLVATTEPGEPCLFTNASGNTLWYSWVAPAWARADLSSASASMTPLVAVYQGSSLADLRAVTGAVNSVTFEAKAGTTYYFQLDGAGEVAAAFTLNLAATVIVPPANDAFAQATRLKGVNAIGQASVARATLEPGEPVHPGPQPCKSVWWDYQAPVSGFLSLDAAYTWVRTGGDIHLGLYTGSSLETLTLVAEATGALSYAGMIGGTLYHIALVVPADSVGDVSLELADGPLGPTGHVPGNLVREGSFEERGIFTPAWQSDGSYGGSVHEMGAADGSCWVVLQTGTKLWQDVPTVPGRNYEIRLASDGNYYPAQVSLRVSWGDTEVGVFTIPPEEYRFWHWASFRVRATSASSRLTFEGLENYPGLDAISVVWVNDPPHWVTQPGSVSTYVGGTASFLASANGTEPLAYQWYRNGLPLAGQTRTLLWLDNVTAAQAGDYYLTVTNAFGAVTSATVHLTVETPLTPIIVLQPAGGAVAAGGYYSLSAAVLGQPPLSYQWFRDGAELQDATNRQWTFDSIQAADAGSYSLKAWNSNGVVWSLSANISVETNLVGGGMVRFANHPQDTNTLSDSPVFDVDGVTKLSGDDFVAQLYAGPSLALLRPVGAPSPFGIWNQAGLFLEQILSLPTVPPYETAWLQVRAWQRSTGASYEEARALGKKFGRSEAFSLVTADEMEPPPDLAGLSSFHLQAGLPEFNVGRIEFVGQTAGLGVWSLQGAAGFQYVVEKSVSDFVWRPLLVLTNTSGTATFSDPVSSTNVFYRARIID